MTNENEIPQPTAQQIIYDYILQNYRDERGLHVETVLSALGAFAGYGCQAAIREGLVAKGEITEDEAFLVVKTVDGETFYFGEFLNEPLLSTEKDRVSVYGLVASAALSAGAQELPNIEDIAAHAAKTVGHDNFGIPRLIPAHMPHELPIESLKKHWENLQAILEAYCPDPLFWGWEFASLARSFIVEGKDVINPAIAALVVMEAAIPMSKVQLHTTH